MIRRTTSIAILALVASLGSGCMTWITSERLTDNAEGLRYALPAVFLRVTPQPNGTMMVEKLILPDESQEYVLRVDSFIAAYSFNATVASGLLTSATFAPDTTGVAAKAVETTGNLLKTRIETSADAQGKRNEAAQRAKSTAEEAKTELIVAEVKLQRLKDLGKTGFDIEEAETAVAVARAKFERARQAAAAFGFTEFNAPGSGADRGEFPKAWGPVLYRVVMSRDGVALQPVAEQRQFDTSVAAKPASAANAPSLELKFTPLGGPIRPGATVVLQASEPLQKVDLVQLRDAKTKQQVGPSLTDKASVAPNNQSVTVQLPSDTPDGRYTLEVVVHTQAKPAIPNPQEVSVEVKR
jgi:hypothetical protein